MTCSTFDFGDAIKNAEIQFIIAPHPEFSSRYNKRKRSKRGHQTFQHWIYDNYKITVFLKIDEPFPHKANGRWGVYEIGDDELATMFKLKYG